MTQIDAIFRNGVFKPLQEVNLPENQRVRLSVQPFEPGDIKPGLPKYNSGNNDHRRARLLPRQHPGHRRGPTAMSDTVVDSSVAAKWILPETDSVQAGG